VWQEDPRAAKAAAANDWDQRVLKHQPPLKWQSPQRPAASYQQTDDTNQAIRVFEPTAVSSQQARDTYQTARRSSYDGHVFDGASAPQEPVVTGRQRPIAASEAEVIEPGTTQFEPMAANGVFAGGPRCTNCGGPDGACGCDPCEGPARGERCDLGWEVFDGRCGPLLRGISVFAGADGFKGPLDRGTNGNFGLNEGINMARPLGDPWGCGYQLGANFVQTDFSGAPLIADTNVRAAFRKQYFATAGIFRRTDCRGFQWGVAYDYLYDMYYSNASLQQFRSETSFVLDDTYEIGYYGAYGVGNARATEGLQAFKFQPTDMFVLFVRRNFENCGDGRLWAGATGNGDGLLGVDLWVPLGGNFALENRINYLIPKQGTGETGQQHESWGLVVQLVWYPGHSARCEKQNPYRPFFNVADNSLFMVDRLTNQ
jgi:hypothetical protein